MQIYTIGYGGRHPDEFIALLRRHEVRAVADVRLRPDRASMGAYALAKTPDKGIQALLAKVGIEYVSLVELGNVFLAFEDWRERYDSLLAVAGELLTQRLTSIPVPYCLLCAEKRVAECHRSSISAFLATRGHEIAHIE